MIPRLIEDFVFKDLTENTKAIIILGARQVGKTTLVKALEAKIGGNKKVRYLSCDLDEQRGIINTTSLTLLSQLLENIDVLFVDEAQRIDNPGLTLKIIHDNFPKTRLLATGSSSFELQNKLSDAMTGRYFDFTLYPLSFTEALQWPRQEKNKALLMKKAEVLLPSVLTYGLYPEVYQEVDPLKKQELMQRIIKSYLFKDILSFQKVKHSQAIQDLARALAYQIGSEVNESELGNRLGINKKTVASYIDILEQAFVVVRVRPYSKNPRREIGGKYKVYFIDLGIRNGLIGDFNNPLLRNDLGFIWENFLIIERMKAYANANTGLFTYNFWRSYSGAEVDYIEKPLSTAMRAYEFKYSENTTLSKGAHTFEREYNTIVQPIHKGNYLDFICK